MEQILGVVHDAREHKTHEDWVASRMKTVEADALDQVEGDDQARARYQRMFWEPVVEGQVRGSQGTHFYFFANFLASSGTCAPDCVGKGARRCQTARAV